MAITEGLQILSGALAPATAPPAKTSGWAAVDGLTPITVVLEDDSEGTPLFAASNAAGPLKEGFRVWVTLKDDRLTVESSPQTIEEAVEDSLQALLEAEAAAILAAAAETRADNAYDLAEEAKQIGDANAGEIGDLGTAVDDAQAAADAASQAAAQAAVAAGGASGIIVDPLTPSLRRNGSPLQEGDLWYKTVAGNISSVYVFDGSGWVTRQIVANSVLVPSSVGAILIEDGAITAPKIHVDALDFKTATGMVITSGTFQTTETANRGVKMTPSGIIAYDNSGNVTATINGTSGALTGFTVTGGTLQTTAQANRGIKITSGGLVAYDNAGNATATINAAGGSFTGYSITGSTITGGLFQTEAAANRGLKINSSGLIQYSPEGAVIAAFTPSVIKVPRVQLGDFSFLHGGPDVVTLSSTVEGVLQGSIRLVSTNLELSRESTELVLRPEGIRVEKWSGVPGTRYANYDLREAAFYVNDARNAIEMALGVGVPLNLPRNVIMGPDGDTEPSFRMYRNRPNYTAESLTYLAGNPVETEYAIALRTSGVTQVTMRVTSGGIRMQDATSTKWVAYRSDLPTFRKVQTNLNSGTTIAAGGLATVTITYSNQGTPVDAIPQFRNFPAGSANLNPRLSSVGPTSCVIQIANTGSAAATLGSSLVVGALLIYAP